MSIKLHYHRCPYCYWDAPCWQDCTQPVAVYACCDSTSCRQAKQAEEVEDLLSIDCAEQPLPPGPG